MSRVAFPYDCAETFVDPYACDASGEGWWGRGEDHDFLLPPPNPIERLKAAITPRDQRRLELNATLTAAGIPPCPGDREAIEQLSALPDGINATLQRWLHHGS
ncbi:hypothetical protein [Streptomyces sp. DH10]|uniref:hypothetical protein n=1 Tax=Streptomyces sp. DH10 TaxID=3040121 RepID=UPI0024433D21|nr:hypothetical protein [Streptomyces sp. DH10]MDG9709388.1 hypothetical protein [Streptomyces sp. DH10]